MVQRMKQSEWLKQVVACPNCQHTSNLIELYLCEKHATMLIRDVDSEEKRNIDMILQSDANHDTKKDKV